MPQMAPLNWPELLIVFTLIFMLFNSMNYFVFMYNVKLPYKPSSKSPINWTW